MLRTVNTVAAISRGQPLAELLAQHFGRENETLTNGRHVSKNSLRLSWQTKQIFEAFCHSPFNRRDSHPGNRQ